MEDVYTTSLNAYVSMCKPLIDTHAMPILIISVAKDKQTYLSVTQIDRPSPDEVIDYLEAALSFMRVVKAVNDK